MGDAAANMCHIAINAKCLIEWETKKIVGELDVSVSHH